MADADDDEEIQVGPVEAESAAEVLARIEARQRDVKAKPYAAPPTPDFGEAPTFTLKQMFIGLTAICVWLAVLRLLTGYNKGLAAGVTGLAALIGVFYLSPENKGSEGLTWWLLFAVYLTTSAVMLFLG